MIEYDYKVVLYAGNIEVGTYFVRAKNCDEAKEKAWKIAKISFSSDVEKIKRDE